MVMEEQEPNMELASENIPVPQVQEPKIDTIKRNNKSSVSRGKPRLRKKALHASIVKQMEFYFSDANLSKDRFLAELLKKDPYIDLDVFTRCNKLRELSADTNRIAKALQGSTMLKVSEDGTKVCRLTPINKKENVDECTIYVQNLPPDTDHEWLISIFSKYGPVEYVSIPRYKSNKKIKGFAFVEFDAPSSAQECIKRFQKKGCVLPSHTSPNDLLSITTFDDPKKDCTIQAIKSNKLKSETNEKEKALEDESEGNDNVYDNKMDNDKQSLKKRKLVPTKSFVIDESDIKVKRRKKSMDQSIIDQQNDQMSQDETENKDNNCNNEIDTVDNNSRQNLKRKRVSQEESRVINENDVNVNITENSNIENQENKNVNRNKIIEKKRRRVTINDTITVEDISGETVKKEFHESATISSKNKGTESDCLDKGNDDNETSVISQTEKHPTTKDVGMTGSDIEEASIDEKKKKRYRKKRSKFEDDDICNMIGLQVMAKSHWKHLRNRYLDLQKSKMQQLKQHLKKAEVERGGIITKRRWNYDKSKYERDNGKNSETEKSSYGRVNYASGIIVKIEMDQPCTDLQSFKMGLKDNNSSVKYIDVTPGSCQAFVRCDTAEAAQLFAQKSHEGRCLTVLEDDEEKAYWDKIARDRDEKLSRKKKVKQRGRYKLLKRAEKELGKCIKFDQD